MEVESVVLEWFPKKQREDAPFLTNVCCASCMCIARFRACEYWLGDGDDADDGGGDLWS